MYLCPCPLLKSASSRLPPGPATFSDQELLEKTSGQVKEDSIISSNVSLSRLAPSGFKGSAPLLTLPLLPVWSLRGLTPHLVSAPVLRLAVIRRSAFVVAGAGLLLRLGRVFRSRSHVPVRFP